LFHSEEYELLLWNLAERSGRLIFQSDFADVRFFKSLGGRHRISVIAAHRNRLRSPSGTGVVQRTTLGQCGTGIFLV
jgi:hypothetical protein